MNIKELETTEGKICTKCGKWKLLEEYHKNKNTKDGRMSMCKECRNVKKEVKEGMKKCSKCGEWKVFEEFNKHKSGKYGRRANCKGCEKRYSKQYRKNNIEHIKVKNKQWRENNKEYCKEYAKQWGENNKEHVKEKNKQYLKNNAKHIKEYHKQRYKNNATYYKQCSKQNYQNNIEYYRQRSKQRYKDNSENNLQYISSIVEQISPIFKQLNLPMYGYIYLFANIKTGHRYVGQTTLPLSERYGGNITKSWIKERKRKKTQKFLDEINEEDIVVTELFDVGCCQYHLDKLEAYYIDKYDSCNNGYNNNYGNYNTDDGIEEFNQILSDHNLEFKDGKLIQIKAPTQR
jgi:hypothetical protein